MLFYPWNQSFEAWLQEIRLLNKMMQWFLSPETYCCTAEKLLSIFWALAIEKKKIMRAGRYPAGIQRPWFGSKSCQPKVLPGLCVLHTPWTLHIFSQVIQVKQELLSHLGLIPSAMGKMVLIMAPSPGLNIQSKRSLLGPWTSGI